MEVLVVGAVLFVIAVLLSILGVLGALVGWVILLPLHLFGLVLRGLVALLALPFLAVGAVIVTFLFLGVVGAGLIALLLPAAPLLILAAIVVWLFARRKRPVATASL